MKPISEKSDTFNKMLIRDLLKISFSRQRREQLLNGTPEERAKAVAKRKIFLFGFVLFLIFPSSLRIFLPGTSSVPPKPEVVIEEVGAVQNIQIQKTFLTTSSMVETTIGFYQASGAISADKGDRTFVKKTEKENGALYPLDELCVESKKQTKCYPIN